MSKTISPGLKADYAKGSRTLVKIWRLTRQDGQTFYLTNFNRDFMFQGNRYTAPDGFVPANQSSSADLSVQNSEVRGLLIFPVFTEADIRAGVWDFAQIIEEELNIENLANGVLRIATGDVGQVSINLADFTAETRGISQALQQTVGRVYAAQCDAKFGDARCKVDAEALKVTGTVSAVVNRAIFDDVSRNEADDWFGAGVVTWLTGNNAGRSMEVRDYQGDTNGGRFIFQQSMVEDIQVGDTYEATPGCRKRMLPDCKGKWNNIVNFRGFDLPLNDVVIGYSGVRGA